MALHYRFVDIPSSLLPLFWVLYCIQFSGTNSCRKKSGIFVLKTIIMYDFILSYFYNYCSPKPIIMCKACIIIIDYQRKSIYLAKKDNLWCFTSTLGRRLV